MSAPLAHGRIDGKIRPYTRVLKEHIRQDARDYLASQAAVGHQLRVACHHLPDRWSTCRRCKGKRVAQGPHGARTCPVCSGAGQIAHKIIVPYRIGLIVEAPAPDGELPRTRGDWDNFLKALLDAAICARVVVDDSLFWFRGPAPVEGRDSGAYPADAWAFIWAIYPIDPAPAAQAELFGGVG